MNDFFFISHHDSIIYLKLFISNLVFVLLQMLLQCHSPEPGVSIGASEMSRVRGLGGALPGVPRGHREHHLSERSARHRSSERPAVE